MKDLGKTLRDAIDRQLKSQGYTAELLQIPSGGDRTVRIRTLEEALDEIDRDPSGSSIGYVIQVRPTLTSAATSSEPPPVLTGRDAVYLPDGRLNSSYLFKNAQLLFQAGEYPLARNIFSAILKTGERAGHCFYWIGRCHEAEGRSGEAISCYEESITFHPALEAYQRYSALLVKAQKNQQAAEAIERALVNLKDLTSQSRIELYKAAGNCWLRCKQLQNAERNYRHAVEMDPNADEIQASLGALLLQSRKIVEARAAFETALAANPKNPQAISGLGSCALAMDEKRAAHDYFAKSLDIFIHQPTALFHLVKCAYEVRSYATAARIVAEYTQVAPINANLLYSLAGLQFHLGRIQEAQITARRIIELQPGHSGASELLETIKRIAGI